MTHSHLRRNTLVLALCAATVSTARAEILLGIVGPFSGNVALSGEQMELGARRAVADLNQTGGVLGETVSVLVVDDACDELQAVAAAEQVIAADVAVVIGHLCSRTSIKASEVYAKSQTLMISPASTNPTVTERGLPAVFRVIGRDDQQAKVAAGFILERFEDRTIALLHNNTTYARDLTVGVKQALNAAGKEEVMFGTMEAEQDSYIDVVADIVESGAELVYLVTNGVSDAALLTLQIKEKIPDAVVMSADAISGDGFALIAREAAEGTFFTFGPDPRSKPSTADVVERFREEDAYEPEGYTLYSYAAVQAWASAVADAGTIETSAVIDALRSGEFQTVIGEIGFDAKGDVTGDGSFVVYEWGPYSYTQVE